MLYGPGSKQIIRIVSRKVLFTISGAKQWTCWKSASRSYFWPFLGSVIENAWNRLPEGTFDHIWCQAAKMLKINCGRPLLTISEAKQQQCSKPITGVYIGPYLETCYQVLEKWYQVRATRYYIRYTIYYIPHTIYHILHTIPHTTYHTHIPHLQTRPSLPGPP